MFGTDYNTPDGTCIRDYIHVADLASAHVLALCELEKGSARKAYNLGTGRGYSVREIVAAAACVTGLEVPSPIVRDVRGSGRPRERCYQGARRAWLASDAQ